MRLYLFIFLLISFFGKAQNLVPNGSFETYTVCPTAAQFYNLPPWCGLGGGEEAFNKCFSTLYGPGGFGVPDGVGGFQYARTGDGFGSCIMRVGSTAPADANRREYLHVPLLTSLVANKTYCGTMYVNLENVAKYTTDRIGMALTSNSFVCNQAFPSPQVVAPLNITPQIENILGNYITDTLTWMEVSGTFTATGVESYLTIGNFHDDINSSYIIANNSSGYFVIYFFIDDVSVEEVFPAKAKNDTTIMFGDSTLLGNNLSDAATYNWQPTLGLSCPSCANPNASPNVTTTYTLTKTQCKAVTSATITVNVDNVGVNELNIDAVTFLSPNPTNGVLNISSRFEMEKVEVTSVTGQLLMSEQVNQKEHQLKLNDFAEGIYFVKVIYPNGLRVTRKIIINR